NAVRRSDPDARGNTTDIQYIYMRNQSDRGLELINDDSWWWLKRNSDRIFNDAQNVRPFLLVALLFCTFFETHFTSSSVRCSIPMKEFSAAVTSMSSSSLA